MIKIMKTAVLCLVLLTTCFAVENTRTEPEQLKVQKREKQYVVDYDPNEKSEQKKDKGSSVKNINNLDPKGNSPIINIRIQPNLVKEPNKQGINPVFQKPRNIPIDKTPQRIPTKIPVILKSGNVIPGSAHRLRNLGNLNKPYFTIEDRPALKTGYSLCPPNVDEEIPSRENNIPLKKDEKQTSDNDENKDQVCLNTDKKATSKVVPKSKYEPEFNRQYMSENKAEAPNKQKEILITKSTNNNKKCKSTRKNYESNNESDPDIVQIRNETHIITIEKISNQDNNKNKHLERNEEEKIPRPAERIINKETPKQKTAAYKTDKYAINVNKNENSNVGLAGVVFNTNKEETDQSGYITITGSNCEEFKEKSPIVSIQVTNTPTKTNEGSQAPTWNYFQNPYYNLNYQNLYDQYRRPGLGQNTPNIYGQECYPSSYGEITDPEFYGLTHTDPCTNNLPIIEPYYPNGYPPVDDDSNPYCPNELEVETTIWPETCADDSFDVSTDVEENNKNDQPKAIEELDIDIRRFVVPRNDGNNGDVIGKVANPYASLPVNLNGRLIYPYGKSAYRCMR